MTVRAWFRMQRAALWEQPNTLAGDIDTIACAVTRGEQPAAWVRIGSLRWIESIEEYRERERVFALVKRDVDEAIRRLHYGKDLTA